MSSLRDDGGATSPSVELLPATNGGAADAGPALRALMIVIERFQVAMFRAAGVHPNDARALIALSELGRLTPGALAAQLQIGTPTATSLIDRLEAAGRVRRLPHPSDRRSVLVTLTPESVERLDRAARQIEALVADMPDQAGVARVLEDVGHRLERAVAAAASFVGDDEPADLAATGGGAVVGGRAEETGAIGLSVAAAPLPPA